jgi:hypothetical protein
MAFLYQRDRKQREVVHSTSSISRRHRRNPRNADREIGVSGPVSARTFRMHHEAGCVSSDGMARFIVGAFFPFPSSLPLQ